MATSIFILLVWRLARWSHREISSLLRPAKVLGSDQKKNKNTPPPANKKIICRDLGDIPLATSKKKAVFGMLQPNRPRVLVPLSKTHQKTPETNENR